MSEAAPIVLFGVGAMKSGTSWLHDMLDGHPLTHFRTIKEMHYFSMFDQDYRETWVEKVMGYQAQADALIAQKRRNGKPHEMLLQRQRDRQDYLDLIGRGRIDAQAYLDYLRDGMPEDTRVIGEITPKYATLSAERLAFMAGIAPRTKFIFVMRDPVARLWSAARMIGPRHFADRDPETAVGDYLDGVLAGKIDGVLERGDYPATIARLRAAIPPEDLLILFYEDLVTSEGVARVLAFLDLPEIEVDVERQVHAGTPLKMSDAQWDRLSTRLADQYDYIDREVGPLPEAWARNRTAGVQ